MDQPIVEFDEARIEQRHDRPFKVLGIQQIAIGGPDKQRLRKLWVDMLGLEVTGNFNSERENVDEDICAIGSGPFKVEVDLMQPIDPDKKPAVHATPLNHVGLWVDDLPRGGGVAERAGRAFAPGGIRKGAAGFDICFVHPKANEEFPLGGEGVLIELVQAPPEVVRAFAALAAEVPSATRPYVAGRSRAARRPGRSSAACTPARLRSASAFEPARAVAAGPRSGGASSPDGARSGAGALASATLARFVALRARGRPAARDQASQPLRPGVADFQRRCSRPGRPGCTARSRCNAAHYGVHALVDADDGVGRASGEAQRAADAPGLVDHCQRARAFGAALRVQRQRRPAGEAASRRRLLRRRADTG